MRPPFRCREFKIIDIVESVLTSIPYFSAPFVTAYVGFLLKTDSLF